VKSKTYKTLRKSLIKVLVFGLNGEPAENNY